MLKKFSRRDLGPLLLATMMVTAASTDSVRAQEKAAINIDNFAFAPDTLTISRGTTVTWTNRDDIPHSIVEINNLFHSSAFDTNGTYSFTFNQTGTYDYVCGLHPHMKGKIIVK